MSYLLRLLVILFLIMPTVASAGDSRKLNMSLDDVFYVSDSDDWKIDIERELTLRFADVHVTSKHGYPFGMMLYFKCDTPDLAKFDSPEKIARSVRASSEKYLPNIVERKIDLEPISVKGSYGSLTVLTDAEVARKTAPAPGEFKYLTRGMIRLSKDSALGFSIMTNDISSADYKRLLEYVYGFIKAP
jgi:hypothetical protein